MAKKAKKAAKKSGAKKPPKKAAKKNMSPKKATKKSSKLTAKKTFRAPVKRSKPKVPVNEPNKGFVSRAVDAIKEVAAPLMPSKEPDKPTEH